MECIKTHVDLKREYKVACGVIEKEENKCKLLEGTYAHNIQVHSLQHRT